MKKLQEKIKKFTEREEYVLKTMTDRYGEEVITDMIFVDEEDGIIKRKILICNEYSILQITAKQAVELVLKNIQSELERIEDSKAKRVTELMTVLNNFAKES